MLTIILPAAGKGTRFREAGYDLPKPMVDVFGKPMLKRVMENLRPNISHQFVVITRLTYEHTQRLPFRHNDINLMLEQDTEGAVDTILKAEKYLTVDPVLIGNTDQLVDFDVNQFIIAARGVDGALVTFKSNKPHHSYVTERNVCGGYNIVDAIAEKRVISNQAVCGVYYFAHGTDFLRYAKQVIAANDRYNSEFYVSSVISRMIDDGLSFVTHDAPSFMLGTPEELQLFEVAINLGRNVL